MLIRAFLWGNDLKAFPLLKSAIFAFPHECHLKPTTTTTTWNSKQKLKSAIFCFFYQSFFVKANKIEITHIAKRSYIQGIHIGNNVLQSCTKISRYTIRTIAMSHLPQSSQKFFNLRYNFVIITLLYLPYSLYETINSTQNSMNTIFFFIKVTIFFLSVIFFLHYSL